MMKILICRIWVAFALSLAIGDAALAQGQTINQLGAGTALVGTEKIPMYQSANPAVTTTPSALAVYINSLYGIGVATALGNNAGAAGGFATYNSLGTAAFVNVPLSLASGGLGGSQAAATANQVPVYPGTGGAAVPTTITPAIIGSLGTDVATALGVNIGTAGAFTPNNVVNTWTAIQTFTNSDIKLLGSSTGATTFTSANAGASNYTLTFPAATATLANLTTADQALAGGATVTAASLGTVSSGTTTIDCGTSPLQYLTNNGAFTLAAPANDSSCILQVTNGASAGAITFSGFTVGSNTGSALDTTNGHKFMISIARVNGSAVYNVMAQQ